ncbi:Hypothetical protein (Fragment) [Durusdinium trenchii]|uniref:Pentatricopeptide repeat-containing protein n=1 Tax=Durusdinium trenchii TaxID=1381693 RepID=A0ABP0LAP9_9DINO
MRCGEPTRTIPSPGPGAPASPRHRSDEEATRLARLDLDPWKAEPKLAMEGLKHLASRKGPLLVLQMIRSMQVANVRVDYFHCGVAISACNQRWQSAMQVLRCMRSWGIQQSTSSFNAVAAVLPWSSSVHLMADGQRREVRPDVVGFNIQLSRSQWLQGLGLLGHMNSRQLRLDEFGASALLAHKAQASWQMAQELHTRMESRQARAAFHKR